MSREGKLAKNTLVLAVGNFVPKLASFVTLPILTGCLTKEEYGIYDLILVLVSLLLPTVTLQIQSAAFRFLIDSRDNEKGIITIVTNIVVFIIPTSFCALIVLFFCLGNLEASIRIIICLYFIVDIYVNALRQVARGLDKTRDYSISAILSATGKLVFTVVCVYWMKAGLFGTILALFMASLFSLLYLALKSKIYKYIKFSCFDKAKLKEMLSYSWPMVPNSVSAWVMRVSDRIVITAVMGVSMNAVYAVANKLPSLLSLAQNTFTLAWQENASIASKDQDASEYYSFMFRMLFDLMAGGFGVLISATPLLFHVLVRGDYTEAFNQMPILYLAMFFFGMSTFLGGIYVAYMKSKNVGVTTTVAAAINLIADLVAIKWIGLYAASGSTLLAYVCLFMYRILDVQKIIRVRVDVAHTLVVISIMIVESFLCLSQRIEMYVINLIVGILVFFIINQSFFEALKKRLAIK